MNFENAIKHSHLALFIVLTLSFITLSAQAAPVKPPTLWFNDIKSTLSISDTDLTTTVKSIYKNIQSTSPTLLQLPASLEKDNTPRLVFLSISDGAHSAQVFLGAGNGLKQAINHAIHQARSTNPKQSMPLWLKVDFVDQVKNDPEFSFIYPLPYNPTLQGIAFDKSTKLFFLPGQILSNNFVNDSNQFKEDALIAYFKAHPASQDWAQRLANINHTNYFYFTTSSYFTDGTPPIKLYRDHRLVKNLLPDEILNSLNLAGQYFLNVLHDNGKFDYLYYPKNDKTPNEYNILRHAGSAYSMLELYELTHDKRLLAKAKKALDFLITTMKPCGKDKKSLCIIEFKDAKLGGNGLGLIAFSKYTSVTKDKRYLPQMKKLATWIVSLQQENGRFYPHIIQYPSEKPRKMTSGYYPGEAMLGLIRLYAIDPQPQWLITADKAANYLINERDKEVSIKDLPHDHWLLYALNEIYRQTKNPTHLNHAMKITQSIINSQNRTPQYADWLGSFYNPPRSTPSATRSEGLASAYKLANDFVDKEKTNEILEALNLSNAFQLQLQFRPESVMYFKKPSKALGGFRASYDTDEIRIDYVQHNLSALIAAYKILMLR